MGSLIKNEDFYQVLCFPYKINAVTILFFTLLHCHRKTIKNCFN